jgi:D-3-phosphoglycerate dehydrogenase
MRVRVLRLLSSEPFHHPEVLALLRASFSVVEGDYTRDELLHRLADVDVLWVKLRHHVDREVLERAPVLRWIATPTTGLNHIDGEEAARRGIDVVSLRGESAFLRNIRATAELTVGLTLALLRHIPAAAVHVREGLWDRDLFRGTELYGKTCGIIGLGRLGKLVAGYMQAFGMTVIACDPNPDEVPEYVAIVSLEELAARADVISVHAAYQPSTHGLLSHEFFSSTKQGALLVNTARGEIVEEAALIAALESGRIAGAALDVISGESGSLKSPRPLVAYARNHSNVLITPHIGGNTEESRRNTDIFLANKLIANCERAKCAGASREV